jgi:hypothetical protein
MTTHRLTNAIVTAAIEGFESQKERIDAQIAEIRQMLDGGPKQAAATLETPRPKRKITAAARRRMKEGQQRRWARIRGESEPPSQDTPEGLKPKRKMSAAGRAAIVAALKKRWAAKRAGAGKAKKPQQAPAAKRTARK